MKTWQSYKLGVSAPLRREVDSFCSWSQKSFLTGLAGSNPWSSSTCLGLAPALPDPSSSMRTTRWLTAGLASIHDGVAIDHEHIAPIIVGIEVETDGRMRLDVCDSRSVLRIDEQFALSPEEPYERRCRAAIGKDGCEPSEPFATQPADDASVVLV